MVFQSKTSGDETPINMNSVIMPFILLGTGLAMAAIQFILIEKIVKSNRI